MGGRNDAHKDLTYAVRVRPHRVGFTSNEHPNTQCIQIHVVSFRDLDLRRILITYSNSDKDAHDNG